MATKNIEDKNNYPIFISKYSYLQYTPSDPSDWSNVPADVYTALDELAVSTGGGSNTIITASPVIGTGTVGAPITFASDTANKVLATPDGSSGVPSMRALVPDDIPTLNQNTTGTASNITATTNNTLTTLSSLSLPVAQTTGTIPITSGGTGQTSKANAYNALTPMSIKGDITYESADGIASRLPIGSSGQILTVSGGVPAWTSTASNIPTTSQTFFTQVYYNGYLTIHNNLTTKLTYNTTHPNNAGQPIYYNTNTCWNISTGTFTAPRSGVYQFDAYMEWVRSAFNFFQGPANIILYNLSRAYPFACGQINNLASTSFQVGCSGATYLNSGDQVVVYVYQNSTNDVLAHNFIVSSYLVTSN